MSNVHYLNGLISREAGEGELAFFKGKTLEDNPYGEDQPMYYSYWEQGWRNAKKYAIDFGIDLHERARK